MFFCLFLFFTQIALLSCLTALFALAELSALKVGFSLAEFRLFVLLFGMNTWTGDFVILCYWRVVVDSV